MDNYLKKTTEQKLKEDIQELLTDLRIPQTVDYNKPLTLNDIIARLETMLGNSNKNEYYFSTSKDWS